MKKFQNWFEVSRSSTRREKKSLQWDGSWLESRYRNTKLLIRQVNNKSSNEVNMKFSCKSYKGRFSHNYQLKNHQMQRQHGAYINIKISLKCNECEGVFRGPDSLNNHKQRQHRLRTVKCDLCGKESKQKSDLIRHLTTHVNKTATSVGRFSQRAEWLIMWTKNLWKANERWFAKTAAIDSWTKQSTTDTPIPDQSIVLGAKAALIAITANMLEKHENCCSLIWNPTSYRGLPATNAAETTLLRCEKHRKHVNISSISITGCAKLLNVAPQTMNAPQGNKYAEFFVVVSIYCLNTIALSSRHNIFEQVSGTENSQ